MAGRSAAGRPRKPRAAAARQPANRRLLASLHDPSKLGHEGETKRNGCWCCTRKTTRPPSKPDRAFRLTLREAEVLFWVSKGKTNKDIGEILGKPARAR
jgi:DNA-binding NarL/FixJ family response regulator